MSPTKESALQFISDKQSEELPEPRKRANSDPNVSDDITNLTRKYEFPGLGEIIHLKKGWLIKQENDPKDWTKHWFVLSDHTLKYYSDSKNEEAEIEDGCIELSSCVEVTEAKVSKNYGFIVKTHESTTTLAAMTNGIRNNWIQAILKAMAAIPPPELPPLPPQAVSVNPPDSIELEQTDKYYSRERPASVKERLQQEEEYLPATRSSSAPQPRDLMEKSGGRNSPVPSRKFLPDVDYMLGRKPANETPTPAKKLATEESTKMRVGSPIKFESNPVYLTKLEAIRSPTTSRRFLADHTSEKPGSTSLVSSEHREKTVTEETSDNDSEEQEESEDGEESDVSEQEEPEKELTIVAVEKVEKVESQKQERSDENEHSESDISDDADLESKDMGGDKSGESSGETSGNITSSSGDAMLVELLETEVESLKAQLEKTQKELIDSHQQTIELKTQMTTARRDHRESFSELEDDQNKYLTQIEDMNSEQNQIAQQYHHLKIELQEAKNLNELSKNQLQQLKKRLSDANSVIHRQENDIGTYKTKLEIAVSELTETKEKARKLEGDLRGEKEKSVKVIDILREKSERLDSQVSELKTMLKKAEGEIHVKSKCIREFERSRNRQDSEIKIEHLTSKLEEARQRLKESERDCILNEERFEKRFLRLQNKGQSEKETLEKKLADAEEKVASLGQEKECKDRNESHKLNEELEEQEDKIEELLHQLKTEKTEKSKLQERLDEADNRLAELTLSLQGDSISDVTANTLKLQSVERKLGEVEKKLKDALEDVEREQDVNEHLQDELKEMKAKVNEQQKMIDSLNARGESDNGKERISKLKKSLEKALAENTVSEEYLEKSAEEIGCLKTALQEKSDEIEKLLLQLENISTEREDAQPRLQSSEMELKELRTQLDQVLAEKEKLKKQLDESVEQIEKLQKDLGEKDLLLEDLNRKMNAKEEEYEKLKRDVEKCYGDKGSLKEQILQHTLEISQLKDELQESKRTIKEQEEQLAQKKLELEDAKEKVKQLEDDFVKLQNQHDEEISSKLQELDERKAKINESEKKLAELAQTVELEKTKVSTQESSVMNKDNEKDTNEFENKQLKSKYDSAMQEVRRLRVQLKEANGSYDELEFSLLKSKEDYRCAEENNKEQMHLMGNRIKDLTSKLALADKKLRDSEKRVSNLERKLAGGSLASSRSSSKELETKLEELEMQLCDVEGTLKAQDEETNSLKGKIGSVEEKVSAREEMLSSSQNTSTVSDPRINNHQEAKPVITISNCPPTVEKVSEKMQSSSSTGSESDDSDSSVPREKVENPKQKRLMRVKSLETKLLDTEQKLKVITAKLVDVTTKDLDNRKSFHAKCVSENKLKEQIKDFKNKIELLTKELELEYNVRMRIVGDVSSHLIELEHKLESVETNVLDSKHKLTDLLQELQGHKVPIDKNVLDHCSGTLLEVEKQIQETKDVTLKVERALVVQKDELQERENPELTRCKQALRKSSAESQSSEMSVGSLKSMDDAVTVAMDLLRDQLAQTEERLEEKCEEIDVKDKNLKEVKLDVFADRLALEAVKMVTSTAGSKSTRISEDDRNVENYASALSAKIVKRGELGAALSRARTQMLSVKIPGCALENKRHDDDGSDNESNITHSKRNLSPRRAISEPLLRSVYSDDTSQVGEYATTLAQQALKEGEITYVIESKVKDMHHQLRNAYCRLEHQQKKLRKLSALCDEGKVEEMKVLVSGFTPETSEDAGEVPLVISSSEEMTEECSEEVTSFDDRELASYAKRIELEETLKFATDHASDEIVKAEMLQILRRVMDMYEKEINIERASCMQMLKVQRQAAEKKHADIERSIRDEMGTVIDTIKERYETELNKLQGQNEHINNKGPFYNDQLMNQFAGIVARRSFLSSNMTHWGHAMLSMRYEVKPQHRRHSLSALSLYSAAADNNLMYPKRLLAKCSSMDDYAEMLAQRAIFQAELTYILNMLHSEHAQQLNALREAYETDSNGKVIESITMEHGRNLTSVRERYEDIIKDEREEQAREMSKFQGELDRTKKELSTVLAELRSKEEYAKTSGNPEISFTLEEDPNDQVEEMTAKRLKHLKEELDDVKTQLAETTVQLKLKTDEHIKEVDNITDVMESLVAKQQEELEEIRGHEKNLIDAQDKLNSEHKQTLEELERKHSEEMNQVVTGYQQRLSELTEQCNVKKEEMDEQTKQVEELKGGLHKYQEQICKLKELESLKEAEIEDLKTLHMKEVKGLNKTMQDFHKQVTEESEIALQNAIAELEENHAATVKQVEEDCEQKIGDAAVEIAEIQQLEINDLNERHDNELKELTEKWEKRVKNVEAELLDRLKESHEAEINKVVKDYEEKMKLLETEIVEGLRQNEEERLNQLPEEYEDKMKALEIEMLDRLKPDEADNDELQAIIEDYEVRLKTAAVEILDLKELHESELKEMQERHDDEMTKLEKEYEEKLKDIEDDMTNMEDELQKETAELKTRYDEDITRIKQMYALKNKDVDAKSDDSAAVQEAKLQFEQKTANMKREYEQRMSKVKVEHEKRMSYMQDNYEDEIGKIRKDNDKNLKQVELHHEEIISKMKREQENFQLEFEQRYGKEINRLRNEQEYKIAELEQSYEDAIENLKRDHKKEVDLIDQEHAQEINDLKSEYEERLDHFAELHETDLAVVKGSLLTNHLEVEEPVFAMATPQQHAQSSVAALREKYEKEVEQLRSGDSGMVKVERLHREAVEQMRKQHRDEYDKLKQQKDRELAQETQATLAAMEKIRKKHTEDMERERSKHHLHGNVNATIATLRREHQEELEKIENEMIALSEQYSSKCMENSLLEEQLATLYRSLDEKKQSIQHLTSENMELNEKMAEELASLRSTLEIGGAIGDMGAEAANNLEVLELYDLKISLRIKESEALVMQEDIERLQCQLANTKQEENEMFAEKYRKLKQDHTRVEEKVKYLERKLSEAYERLKDTEVRKVPAPHTFEAKTKQASKSNLDRERSWSESNLTWESPNTSKWRSEENLRNFSPDDRRLGSFIPVETKKSKASSVRTPTYQSKKKPSSSGSRRLSQKNVDKAPSSAHQKTESGKSSCPDLFTLLVAKKDLFLLHHCFLRISDISEEYLVKCLQLYLSIKEDGPFDAVMDQIKINEMIKKLPVLLSECPIHPCKAFYINQILLCPCNDVFIVDYLRKLTVEQSMIFLEYLHFLLMKTPVCRKKPTKFPAFERTVEWICMILDAQFTQLLIFPDARDLLLQLHETVADKMVFFKELGSVELLLNQLKQRTELPSTQRKKDDTTLYRIEILKLKI
uniref:Golgin subfamily A member 4-like n=1 Tax=Saccoglossus kowalevskii TaxID=10224 RepID=A0ABM0M8K7_SACKO|nr:PREDICTED: golgin subfamily A member 4-like [Saccoglossus kowalevskii]